MLSDRILALMKLIREIEAPLKNYNHQLRRAWRTASDSPENLTAQERGNAALLDIDAAIRKWIAEYPENSTNVHTDTREIENRLCSATLRQAAGTAEDIAIAFHRRAESGEENGAYAVMDELLRRATHIGDEG